MQDGMKLIFIPFFLFLNDSPFASYTVKMNAVKERGKKRIPRKTRPNRPGLKLNMHAGNCAHESCKNSHELCDGRGEVIEVRRERRRNEAR